MRILVLTATAFAVAACSSTGGGKLAVCDAKHLRPANAYGSVLAPTQDAGAPVQPTGVEKAKPKALSALGSPASFGSCGA